MNVTSFEFNNAVKEYCSGIVDVIPPDCKQGCYILSCDLITSDNVKFFVVEITFYYASVNKFDKMFELVMYQQELKRIDIVRSFSDYSSCLTAFNAVKFINH